MQVVYNVDVSCGFRKLSFFDSHKMKELPSKNKLYQFSNNQSLYPKKIVISVDKSTIRVYFVKRFWFWQTKKFNDFVKNLRIASALKSEIEKLVDQSVKNIQDKISKKFK